MTTSGVPALARALLDGAMAEADIVTLTPDRALSLIGTPVPAAQIAGAVLVIILGTLGWFVVTVEIARDCLESRTPSIQRICRRTTTSAIGLCRNGAVLLTVPMAFLAPLVGLDMFGPTMRELEIPAFVPREFHKIPLTGAVWLLGIGVVIVIVYVAVLLLAVMTVQTTSLGDFGDVVASAGSGGWRLAASVAIAAAATAAASAMNPDLISAALWPASSPATHGVLTIVVGLTVNAAGIVISQATAFALVAQFRRTPQRPGERPLPHFRLHRTRAVTLSAAVLLIAAPLAASEPAVASGTSSPLMIAHRGYDTGGPENTIAGLEAAALFHPDYVEVDVQQTLDGGIVASHDTNLTVLAGVNANIFEMTTSDVTRTVVTMHGNSDRIPTMTEYVQRSQDLGVQLLIELKTTGHEHDDFVTTVLTELQHIDGLENNIFHSLNPLTVDELKKQRPELRVGLTVGMLYGQLPKTECDFYVIEQGTLTVPMIESAHALGRQVYAWTVNDEAAMRALTLGRIDGIVTDRLDTFEDLVQQGALGAASTDAPAVR